MSRVCFIIRLMMALTMSRFKLADLQIHAILQKPSAQLAKSALDKLTKNVNDYYNEAMERMASQEETKDMVYNLLTWLTFTLSPIHVHELELALGIRPGQSLDQDLDDQRVDVLRYANLSEGLISINKSRLVSPYGESSDEKSEPSESEVSTMSEYEIDISKGAQVTLAHESIREFLRDIPQPGIRVMGDKFLLHCCLTTMSSPIFVGNLKPIWQQLLHRKYSPWAVENRFSVNFGNSAFEVPVFLFWVLSSWGQHVSDAKLTPDMANAIQKIHQFSAGATTACSGNAWAGPLYWCAYEGWAEACKLLLPLEKDPNAFCKLELDRAAACQTSETCIFAAVASGDVATVQVFLDDDRIKPDLGKQSFFEGHVTPLMQACEQGDREIVQMLLARNDVDVNAYDDYGGCERGLPAILRARPGIISLLLERDDLDVNILRLGRRPVHHLANIGGSPNELEMLLDNTKIDVNGRTAEVIRGGGEPLDRRDRKCFCHSRTALMVAAFVGHPAQTSVLLKHPKIDLQLQDSQGMTALMLASLGYTSDSTAWGSDSICDLKNAELHNSVQQHDETIRILLASSDSEIHERDKRGRTALMFASMGYADPRWKGLDKFSEDLNELDFTLAYETLGMDADLCKDHHVEIVKVLLGDEKVDVNLSDEMGHTALDYAVWTRDLIIQERDWKMQNLKKVVDSCRGRGPDSDGLYLVPVIDGHLKLTTEAQSRIDAMSKVHDVLVASGARSGKPIASLAISKGRIQMGFDFKEVEASEQQKILESLISALEGAV